MTNFNFSLICIMICKKSCTLALSFLAASIATSFYADKMKQSKVFRYTLPPEKKKRYEELTEERKRIYFTGLALGLVCSILLIIFHRNNKNSIYHFSRNQIMCVTVATTFTVCYFYYILVPKSGYIIESLNRKDQREKWLDIYRTMQFRYHAGFALALIGMSILAYGTCE